MTPASTKKVYLWQTKHTHTIKKIVNKKVTRQEELPEETKLNKEKHKNIMKKNWMFMDFPKFLIGGFPLLFV